MVADTWGLPADWESRGRPLYLALRLCSTRRSPQARCRPAANGSSIPCPIRSCGRISTCTGTSVTTPRRAAPAQRHCSSLIPGRDRGRGARSRGSRVCRGVFSNACGVTPASGAVISARDPRATANTASGYLSTVTSLSSRAPPASAGRHGRKNDRPATSFPTGLGDGTC